MRKEVNTIRTSAEQVFRQVKRDLLTGRLPYDRMITEQQLSERYNCSRTPVREATARLVHEGFLRKYSNKGHMVRMLAEEEAEEIRQCRFLLESGAIDMIVKNASDEEILSLTDLPGGEPEDIIYWNNLLFHRAMAALSGNKRLAEYVEQLITLMVRPQIMMRYGSFAAYAENVKDTDGSLSAEHRAIVEALLARDAERAKELLKRDIYPASIFAGTSQERT
jgi:DNA-binding GntR family transcriptional regulator